jgi:metal-dependent hydrolase (beta-lactamase superfamily II)
MKPWPAPGLHSPECRSVIVNDDDRDSRDCAGCHLQRVYTGHCTGTPACKGLKSVKGERIDYIATGRTITV